MPAAGRVVEVDIDRLPGWVQRFADRHGPVEISCGTEDRTTITVRAPDGARADLVVPYGLLPGPPADPLAALVDHLRAPRTMAVLLVRRGGWAVGVVDDEVLVAADTGGGYVQGSTKAGGWSQQRFARRRGNQARQVWSRAADGAAALLVPRRSQIAALTTGGDRAGLAAVLADQRLSWLSALTEPRVLAVPDPTRSVLDAAVRRLRAVAIVLNDRA